MGGDDLSPLCAALLTAATGTGDALGDFIIGYPVSRPALAMLSRELSEMQLVARLLGHNAEEDAVALLPAKLSVTLRNVVEAAGSLVEDINDALGDAQQPSQAWREHAAERLAPLGRLVESSRTAMNLGLDALLYTVNFQPASRSELPPYNSSQILQDARDLRAKLDADAESDDVRVQTHQPALIEFVQALHEYMDQSGNPGGNLGVGAGFNERSLAPVTGTSASSLHSEIIPPIPDYNAIGIANPAPLTITLRHVAKKELAASDLVELSFLQRQRRPAIAVSTMAPPTRFFDTSGLQIRGINAQHGVSMVFGDDGTSWAYLCEEEPKELNPQGHDGVTFKRPVVHLSDCVSGRRVQQMRWPGIKPLGFSPDCRWLALGSARNRIALIDVMSGAVLHKSRVISCHQDDVTHAVFTPDSRILVSQSLDGTIRLTDPKTGKALAKLDTDTWKKPLFLGVSADGDVVVSVRGDNVYHWNHRTSDLESYSLGSRRTREGWPIAVSRDCRFLCCRNDEGVDISDLYSGKVLYTIKFQSGYATSAAFSSDGRFLALGKASSWMGVRVTTSTLDIWELQF